MMGKIYNFHFISFNRSNSLAISFGCEYSIKKRFRWHPFHWQHRFPSFPIIISSIDISESYRKQKGLENEQLIEEQYHRSQKAKSERVKKVPT